MIGLVNNFWCNIYCENTIINPVDLDKRLACVFDSMFILLFFFLIRTNKEYIHLLVRANT